MNNVKIIETMGYHAGEGVRNAAAHLARMERSARAFDRPFDRINAAQHLEGITGADPLRLRLLLDEDGGFTVEEQPLLPGPSQWVLRLSDVVMRSDDPWLFHKTTHRVTYNAARAALPAKVDEYLFANERGELTEGTITTLFVDMGDGLLTPPVSAGLLPGILRETLIQSGQAREKTLHPDDLSNAKVLFVGNSLRGLIPAILG